MLSQIKTNYGIIEGAPAETEGVMSYLGVPYAKPPVGDLRWRAPEEPEPWEGVLSCKSYRPAAMQTKATIPFYVKEFPIDYSKIEISEDCLYLNIWTPAKSADEKLPVMFYIHGGGDVTGFPHEPEHDGAFLAAKNVIYVNVSYRLNIFGFFAHPELTAESPYHASGNYGLLDQLAALKWVHENIAAFGGDPGNVTIFGQSAGAGNVHAHCTSSLSAPYVNKAISVSGSGVVSLMRASKMADVEEEGLRFQKLTCSSSLKELRDLPAAMILAYSQKFSISGNFCIDNYFLFADPNDLIIEGKHLDIPYIVGNTSHEGAAFGEGYKKTVASFKASVDRFFTGAEEFAFEEYGYQTDEETAKSSVDTMADGATYGTHYWAKLHNKYGRRPVYLYNFCHPIPDADGNPSWESCFHSGDLWYFHGTLGRSWRGLHEEDYKLSDLIMTYWTNFARTGDPNGLASDGSTLPTWTPYTADKPETMMFCADAHMSDMADNVGVRALNRRTI